MKRLKYLIPLSAIAVLLFVSVAVAQSIPGQSEETMDQSLVFVGIGPFGFSGDITVDPGTTVTWINRDTKPHTVTADDGTFDSGELEPGESFSFTFDELGWWPYHSELDPDLQGSVTVSEASEIVEPPPETFASDPALMDPALTDPALMDPALTDPTLMDPALADPTLMAPAPTDPTLMDPALTDPTLTDPALMDPALTDPTLTDPALAVPTLMGSGF